jgi:IclR helix-turn-helix domain
MAINKSRKVLLARRDLRVEMQQHEWGSARADDRPLCPIQYGWQRAAHAQTILGILRVFRNTYYPQQRLSDVIENLYVSLPVFIAHVARKPATASQIARALEMPRNTAVRKLDWLIRAGYVTRHGTKYCMTDKVNVLGLEQIMRMHLRLCETSVKNLSILDTRS